MPHMSESLRIIVQLLDRRNQSSSVTHESCRYHRASPHGPEFVIAGIPGDEIVVGSTYSGMMIVNGSCKPSSMLAAASYDLSRRVVHRTAWTTSRIAWLDVSAPVESVMS